MVLKNQLGQHVSCTAVVRPYEANSAIKLSISCATILCLLSSLVFNKATAIVVAMDKEVLHWHCIFSFRSLVLLSNS